MTNHQKLLTHFKGYLIGREYYDAYKALTLCIEHHQGLRKDGNTPYWSHPVAVAAYLRTLFGGSEFEQRLLIAALLHDTLEDTSLTPTTISDMFGTNVLECISALTKNNMSTEEYYSRISEHNIAVLVKVSDRIHNLNTMVGVFSQDKMKEYIQETEEFILPLLKKGRNQYPEDEAAYENMKLMIHSNLQLVRTLLNSI